MRVAFDLDNTLIRNDFDFPLAVAQRPLVQKILHTEPLRLGIQEVFAFCRARHWEVWVYTTSYRSPLYIRKLLWVYGLRADGIINQTRHNHRVSVRSTKHPPTFGIDVLIDDSRGVQLEGERFGFHVIQIEPNDFDWVDHVQARLLSFATAS
ncbi:HAD family hydrolase [Hymenobacter cheonanensis]|uniref:HAD family hydrolase n=1 Tax=Hymenobacter sp. CA2-7 TaxID=3063993 RepID=UPI002712B8D4|nr:HAD family hydrolase [Hymenobacter sp. CA2-7]MDO7883863.1 HAD family hydrolase [Hymenobacter sp. CA2-7]